MSLSRLAEGKKSVDSMNDDAMFMQYFPKFAEGIGLDLSQPFTINGKSFTYSQGTLQMTDYRRLTKESDFTWLYGASSGWFQVPLLNRRGELGMIKAYVILNMLSYSNKTHLLQPSMRLQG